MMSRVAPRDGLLLVLAWAAGIMDAVAYLGFGVFTTMMTGNTALLALALGRGELAQIVSAGLALAAFSAGAAIGALIAGRRRSCGEWPPVVTEALACEGILLAGHAGRMRSLDHRGKGGEVTFGDPAQES